MQIHILNGDALKAQFPKSLGGTILVARECLVDGPVVEPNLQAFYQLRANYLSKTYALSDINYHKDVLPEFEQMKNLAPEDQIVLWFEKDLFCQVNLWFVVHLIKNYTDVMDISFVLPDNDLQHGFGGMSEAELMLAFKHRLKIEEQQQWIFADLWKNYQQGHHHELLEIGQVLFSKFPFLEETLQANAERFPKHGGLGRPEQFIKDLNAQEKNPSFASIFQAFSKEQSIYGFGDLQVKRIFDQLVG